MRAETETCANYRAATPHVAPLEEETLHPVTPTASTAPDPATVAYPATVADPDPATTVTVAARIGFFGEREPSTPSLLRKSATHNPTQLFFSGREIGAGSYGKIYEATLLVLENTRFGYKRYPVLAKEVSYVPGMCSSIPEEFLTHEILMQDDVGSANSGLITLICTKSIQNESGTRHFAVIPYCDAILSDVIERHIPDLRNTHSKRALFENFVFMLFDSMTNALSTLSNNGMVHGDIKPSNMGITQRGNIVLFDFGCTQNQSSIANNQTPFGTPIYMAPEIAVMDQEKISMHPASSDIFSFGKILDEVFTGRRPREDDQPESSGALILEIGGKYLIALREHAAQNRSPIEPQSIQAQLKIAIDSARDFQATITVIINAMTNPLPFLRPNLDTLKHARQKLSNQMLQLTQEQTRALSLTFYQWGSNAHCQDFPSNIVASGSMNFCDTFGSVTLS
jgi:serine/threonine protein kinase